MLKDKIELKNSFFKSNVEGSYLITKKQLNENTINSEREK
jgi:hypothetical protein